MKKLKRKIRKAKRKALQTFASPKVSETLKVFDIPLSQLEESSENPNEQDEATFDQLVEGIKQDGFDEPIIVVPILDADGKETGRYVIVSGHHRAKAAEYLGHKSVPCVIKKGWDEDARKLQLVRRNMLKGNFNPEKFTKLFNDLRKRYDQEVLKKLMGFTKRDAFQKVYKQIEKSVSKEQKKQLAEAKENIKSVDDLSSILNKIFKDHGSELDHGFMVFSFGGKDHHYFRSDKELNSLLEDFEAACKRKELNATEAFKIMLQDLDIGKVPQMSAPKKAKRKTKETKK